MRHTKQVPHTQFSRTGTGCQEPTTETPKACINLTTLSEGTRTALPTAGLQRQELKNKWCFLWSMPVNHSNCPGNRIIQHLLPAPQSRFMSPPVSYNIILSLYFLWWEMSHFFLPIQVWASSRHCKVFLAMLWGQAPPSGFSSYYFSTPPQNKIIGGLEEKKGSNERREDLGGAENQNINWVLQQDTVISPQGSKLQYLCSKVHSGKEKGSSITS